MNKKTVLEKKQISSEDQMKIIGGAVMNPAQFLECKMSGLTSKTKEVWLHGLGITPLDIDNGQITAFIISAM